MPSDKTEYSHEFYRTPETFVDGIKIDGEASAIPLPNMIRYAVRKFEMAGKPMVAMFDRERAAVRIFSALSGERAHRYQWIGTTRMRELKTNSVCKLMTGEAVEGALNGARLKQRVIDMSFHKAWQNIYPY